MEASSLSKSNFELSGHQTRCVCWKHCTLPQTHHPHFKACWWQHHVSWQPALRALVKREGKMNTTKSRELLEDTLVLSSKNYDLGENLFSSKTMTRVKLWKQHEWFKDNKVNVLEWLNQRPDPNPVRNLWIDFKRAVHTWFSHNLAELEQLCKEECRKIQCPDVQDWQADPHRLSAVASQPKVLVINTDLKGVNVYAVI